MASLIETVSQFLSVPTIKAEIQLLEEKLGHLRQLLDLAEPTKRSRKPGPAAKVAKKVGRRKGKRGAVGNAIKAYVASKGKDGANVKEIAAATGNKTANVTAFFYAPANRKAYKKVAPATFALTK